MVDLPELLGALPGDEHLEVSFIGVDGLRQSDLLAVGEALLAAAQQVPDAVERVALAAPLPGDGLLDAAADFVDGLAAELHHVEGVEDGDGVGELVVDGVLVAAERVQGRRPATRFRNASPRALSQSA